MRLKAFLFALVLCGLSLTPAQATRNWNAVVAATSSGGYLIGNPAAPVKVIEYFSLTCPHCRHFAETGMAPLRKNYIASGKVSLELRNFVLNGPDMAASILMRCGTPGQAARLFDVIYANQEQLFANATALNPDAIGRIEAAPADRKAAILARETAIDKWFVSHGLAGKQAADCLADARRQQQLIDLRENAVQNLNVQGTPAFIVNDTTVNGAGWDDLEPVIKQALGS